MAALKKKKEHYVDNKLFLVAMCEYRELVLAEEASGNPKPRCPDYIGECFMKIAEHLSFKPNFINYTFRDDMISDGVENCLQYMGNFDPEKSKNPFAYFTQIIYYAFLRRIQKEKKQLYIRYKAIERSGLMEALATEGRGPTEIPKLYDNMQEFVNNFETNLQKQKEKTAKKKGVEKFITDDEVAV